MAEEKKEKKEGGGGGGMEAVEIFILIVLIVAIALVFNFSDHFNAFIKWANTLVNSKSGGVSSAWQSVVAFWNGFSLVLSALLAIGIFFSIAELAKIRRIERRIIDAHVEQAYETAAQAGDQELTIKWRTILDLTESTNVNDWKQAIIDADTILDQILVKAGFVGDSLGERLTGATKGDIKTLDQAWDAHKTRNAIAHGGSDFKLTQHEAKRVINLYKQVFEEFYFI